MRGGLFSGRLALSRAAAHAEALRPSRSACLLQAGLRPRAPLPPPSTPWGAHERRSKGLPAPGRRTGRLPLPGAGHTQPPADSRGGRGGPHGRQHSSASPVWGRESPCLTPGGAGTPLGSTLRHRALGPKWSPRPPQHPEPPGRSLTRRPFIRCLFPAFVHSFVFIHPPSTHPSTAVGHPRVWPTPGAGSMDASDLTSVNFRMGGKRHHKAVSGVQGSGSRRWGRRHLASRGGGRPPAALAALAEDSRASSLLRQAAGSGQSGPAVTTLVL